MSFFNHLDFDQHEQVCHCYSKEAGLKAIIAIHSTRRGPALGGCRMWSYQNDEEALSDVLRLSRGMTYKAALADLPLGGGKSVIIGSSTEMTGESRQVLMKRMGEFVESLKGRYIIAEDVGTTVEDMNLMGEQCDYVTGSLRNGVGSGDPSPVTAYGVFLAIQESVAFQQGVDSLKGIHVAIQGLGNVGFYLAKYLDEAGACLTVTDINPQKLHDAVKAFGAKVVEPEKIYSTKCDVFAPCALGATINDQTIAQLQTSIVAGGANNQLEQEQHGELLHEKGILYAPDYLINAGGVMSVYYEYAVKSGVLPFEKDWVMNHAAKIGPRFRHLLEEAREHGISTARAADHLAEKILAS